MARHPLIEEISTPLSAPEVARLFHKEPFSFFLDSGMAPENLGRYSFIGSNPFLLLKSHGHELSLIGPQGQQIRKSNPFDTADELLNQYSLDRSGSPTPFVGGAVGYFSYDLCHFVERLTSRAIDDLSLPECFLAFYDLAITFDHLRGKAYVASTGFPEVDERKRLERANQRLQQTKKRLQDGLIRLAPPQTASAQPVGLQGRRLRSTFSPEEYIRVVETAREYIAAGDIFQVNLSQRFEADLTTTPHELFERLRSINPAPFAAYLNFDEVKVVSASPERFLKVSGDMVETRPMKGTRPRGNSLDEDEALAVELQNSTKDKAENVMIVDLERNDLGRVCRFGTVKVRELWTLEKYATVFQLTSTVEGRLRSGYNRIDLLKACFPGGSITGAPKVRSMEIIDELEPTRRSVYTGAIGYLSFDGEMDLNIAIRTILVKNGRAYFQVGGGIIYDSNPVAEYEETMDKAKALLLSMGLSPRMEVPT
ncbi:MAG: aminodeoxychorismate synthase component I [Chloroflexi bacterium]|nr:aminodeoxychorismate synthase component I [Chloroflexota bacterium]